MVILYQAQYSVPLSFFFVQVVFSYFAPDSSSSSLVADARACEYQGAIPKRKQAQHPNSPVKPKKGQKVLRGLPVSVSYLNQSPIQGGDFGNDSKFSSCSPQSIKRVARNAAGYKILCNSSVQDER